MHMETKEPLHMNSNARAISIHRFGESYGPCRSKTYELIASGNIKARKIGRKTVIDVASAEDWYASLPEADIRSPANT
jgi:hypothetical protein